MGAQHRFRLTPERQPTRRARADRFVRHGGFLAAIFGAALLIAGLGYLALVVGPDALVSEDDLNASQAVDARNDVRTTLIQALGGLGLLIGLYFTARSFSASQRSQITERFSRSVGQLGDSEVNVRIGALYALESIGQDSRKEYGAVVEILTRFIRERSESTVGISPFDQHGPDAGGDVQVAVSLLGRRPHHRHERKRLQFRELVLTGARFEGNYDYAEFCYADLDRSAFTRSSFVSAHFGWASMHGAFLTRANLRDATFCFAHLEGAFLRGADLVNADFTEANLEGAVFSLVDGGRMRAVQLDGADFTDALLKGCHLQGVDLREVTGLTAGQISEAVIDDNTQLPIGLDSQG